MKRLSSFLLIMSMGVVGHAQYWKTVGMGVTGMGTSQVLCLYNDTIMDRLLAGGIFFKILNEQDTVWAHSQAAWDGDRWDSLGTGLQPAGGGGEFAPEVLWFLRYQGSLYTSGNFGFSTPDGINRDIARLNEQTMQWEALECINTGSSGLATLVPKEPQDTLYVTGLDGALCDQFPPTCVYSYAGSSFHRWAPFDQIPDAPDRHVSYIFKYKDKTYMVGVFLDPTGPGVASFLRWNGTSWEHVPGWDNLMASIWDYSIRNDTLYVAGDFTMDTGGPGNLVASFDGEQWNDMGGGLQCEGGCWSTSMVNALQWFHGELWACGMFDHAGNIPAHSIAHWDGHHWCVPPGDFQLTPSTPSRLNDMAVWRDSLYVCGLINTVDGEPVHQIAQWIGGDAVGNCSTVGINEVTGPIATLAVTPLAEPGRWNVRFPGNGAWMLNAFDVMGRSVGAWNVSGTQMVLDLADRSQGIYLLRASSVAGEIRTARVVRP
jgi:hypothetical protein